MAYVVPVVGLVRLVGLVCLGLPFIVTVRFSTVSVMVSVTRPTQPFILSGSINE